MTERTSAEIAWTIYDESGTTTWAELSLQQRRMVIEFTEAARKPLLERITELETALKTIRDCPEFQWQDNKFDFILETANMVLTEE